MLRPARAEILAVAIPLQQKFRHALAARSASESVVLAIADEQGRTGFGECAPRSYVSGETCESVRQSLQRLLPPLLGTSYASLAGLVECLQATAAALPRAEHAAFCALELALLDLAGKVLGVSAGAVLGPVLQPQVRYSGVVSADGDAAVRAACSKMRAFGIDSVKVKVGRSLAEDLAALAAARAVLGEQCTLRADANGAWTAGAALARLESFRPFRLAALEQPTDPADRAALEQVTAASPVPIVADESLVSAADAAELAARRACHLFNIRISKCGGLLNAWRIREIGRAAGIGCMLGAQVGETAILSAAGRQFATRAPDLSFAEGSYGRFLLAEDIAQEDLTFGPGGVAPALEGPGLGITVDQDRLRRHVRDAVQLPG